MNKILIKSIDRDSLSNESSKFMITFNYNIQGDYKVKSINFINKIYNVITNYNDKIYFYENGTAKTATLTEGNYNVITLPLNIKTAMDTASGGYNTFTVAIDSNNHKITISASNAFKFEWGTNTLYTAARLLGFLNTDTASGVSLTSTYSVDISAYDSLGIKIQECYTNNLETKDGDRAAIYLPYSNEFGSYALLKTEQSIKFNNSVKTLNITVIDTTTGKEASLNGSEFEIYLSH